MYTEDDFRRVLMHLHEVASSTSNRKRMLEIRCLVQIIRFLDSEGFEWRQILIRHLNDHGAVPTDTGHCKFNISTLVLTIDGVEFDFNNLYEPT